MEEIMDTGMPWASLSQNVHREVIPYISHLIIKIQGKELGNSGGISTAAEDCEAILGSYLWQLNRFVCCYPL